MTVAEKTWRGPVEGRSARVWLRLPEHDDTAGQLGRDPRLGLGGHALGRVRLPPALSGFGRGPGHTGVSGRAQDP
jgi:hypothetical protein